ALASDIGYHAAGKDTRMPSLEALYEVLAQPAERIQRNPEDGASGPQHARSAASEDPRRVLCYVRELDGPPPRELTRDHVRDLPNDEQRLQLAVPRREVSELREGSSV